MMVTRTMKSGLLALAIVFSSFAFGQAFHFDLTERTLIKTTDQSPAHWYLEIFNDVNVDTTLRWKTSFTNVPPEWVITFDDQNTMYNPVNDGDSADFTLYAAPAFPQKLIIGAFLNGTPGHGITYFDVYDPADPSTSETIFFEFVVTPVGLEVIEGNDEKWYTQTGHQNFISRTTLWRRT